MFMIEAPDGNSWLRLVAPMAASKQILVCILLNLIFTNIIAAADLGTNATDFHNNNNGHNSPEEQPEAPFDSSWKIELDQLNSRIRILELSIDERSKEIKSKDESIKQLEMIIREKSTTLTSLQSEMQSVQGKGSVDAKEQVGKAHVRTGELEKQVEILKKEIAQQITKKEALETRANLADRKIEELNLKLEKLQRINDEQRIIIRKKERALQEAEEELMRVQFEANVISKRLLQIRGAWIPHWLAVHLIHFESFTVTYWNAYGRPTLDVIIQKALEKKVQAQEWVAPHVEALKKDWIPGIKEQWLVLVTGIQPNLQLLTVKAVEVYHSSKDTIRPHIVNVQKMVVQYFKEAKKFTKPYINQVSKITKPHVDKAHTILKPYSKKVLRGHRKFLKTIMTYHHQVRATIHEMLTSHEFTAPFATKELERLMASALMVLPVMFLLRKISSLFWKKPKQRVRYSHTSHTRRRGKRVHPDK